MGEKALSLRDTELQENNEEKMLRVIFSGD